mmetsp:Transcript_51231/g.147917  ORF Transcript_51231/g.147917 Transcript_51231/m.147917 type:complete len:370 (+) Transcript_51231:1359-2468(+)
MSAKAPWVRIAARPRSRACFCIAAGIVDSFTTPSTPRAFAMTLLADSSDALKITSCTGPMPSSKKSCPEGFTECPCCISTPKAHSQVPPPTPMVSSFLMASAMLVKSAYLRIALRALSTACCWCLAGIVVCLMITSEALALAMASCGDIVALAWKTTSCTSPNLASRYTSSGAREAQPLCTSKPTLTSHESPMAWAISARTALATPAKSACFSMAVRQAPRACRSAAWGNVHPTISGSCNLAKAMTSAGGKCPAFKRIMHTLPKAMYKYGASKCRKLNATWPSSATTHCQTPPYVVWNSSRIFFTMSLKRMWSSSACLPRSIARCCMAGAMVDSRISGSSARALATNSARGSGPALKRITLTSPNVTLR